MSAEVEEWKPWPRDTAYDVSNLGRVRGPSGKVLARYKKVRPGKRDRYYVETSSGRRYVHRLVWQTWCSDDASDVTHVDGDTLNNRPSNLTCHRLPSVEGAPEEPRVPLTEVGVIVSRHALGESFSRIACDYGVSAMALRNALVRAGIEPAELRRTRAASVASAKAADEAERRAARAAEKYAALGRVKLHEMTTVQRWEYERDRMLRRDYGISLLAFRKMVREQGRKCALCGDPLQPWEHGDERRPDGTHPVVDHCHKSDGSSSVRGILHATCNSACGMVRDDPEIARRMARYLERTRHVRPMRLSPQQQALGTWETLGAWGGEDKGRHARARGKRL